MKNLKFVSLPFMVFVLTSCDFTMYVAVRNYREPARVCVTFRKVGNPYADNDTLKLKDINSPTFNSSLIRQNFSDSTYCFIAPKGKEVALKPITLGGTPIQEIKINRSPDSVLTVDLREGRKELKRLKKAGIIQTKGWPFTHSILVQNK